MSHSYLFVSQRIDVLKIFIKLLKAYNCKRIYRYFLQTDLIKP